VTFYGLTAETTYNIAIRSGNAVDDNSGQGYSVAEGPPLPQPREDKVFGYVFASDAQTPAGGTILSIYVKNDDLMGTSGLSQRLSVQVNGRGYWEADLSVFRTPDFEGRFEYNPSDSLCIEARGGTMGSTDHCSGLGNSVGTTQGRANIILSPVLCTDIPLVVGLNFVVLPHWPTGPMTASTLASEIGSQQGAVAQIDLWNKSFGRWDSYKTGFPFNDFEVALGQAYFLKVAKATIWTMCGYDSTAGITLDLVTGLNGVSAPHASAAQTASSFAKAIENQGGTVAQIDYWDEKFGRWTSHKVGFPFNDFDIEATRGYFLEATSFTP
jgi:hypothetical protein